MRGDGYMVTWESPLPAQYFDTLAEMEDFLVGVHRSLNPRAFVLTELDIEVLLA